MNNFPILFSDILRNSIELASFSVLRHKQHFLSFGRGLTIAVNINGDAKVKQLSGIYKSVNVLLILPNDHSWRNFNKSKYIKRVSNLTGVSFFPIV